MKTLRAPFVIFLLVVFLFSVPAQAIDKPSILSYIPDDYYIHFFGGAAITGWLDKHDVSEGENLAVLLVGSIAKEIMFDHLLFGGAIDATEVGVTLLGALLYRFF